MVEYCPMPATAVAVFKKAILKNVASLEEFYVCCQLNPDDLGKLVLCQGAAVGTADADAMGHGVPIIDFGH
jgi:hypothetical protein